MRKLMIMLKIFKMLNNQRVKEMSQLSKILKNKKKKRKKKKKKSKKKRKKKRKAKNKNE
jgi:hypothetical protein